MAIKHDEIERIVQRALEKIPDDQRWPVNVIEEVFVIIEKDFVLLTPYRTLIGRDERYKHEVNPAIAKKVKELTGLQSLRDGVEATRTTLISTYTELG
jgi:hypothetical protein